MNYIKMFLAAICLCVVASYNSISFASDKDAGKEIMPVWEKLGEVVVPSDYNPAGMKVEYGFDKATLKRHSSNNDYGFWVAKITKAKNEIELVYTRISKDKATYREVQSFLFYLDGTFKDAKMINGPKLPLKSTDLIYKAPELAARKETAGLTNMNLPMFPANANTLELKPERNELKNWICFIDDRSSGLDKSDHKKFTLVTYAYNSEERIYCKGIANCIRTDEKSYKLVGGSSQVFTYEDKLLSEETGRAVWYISTPEAESAIRWYYQMKQCFLQKEGLQPSFCVCKYIVYIVIERDKKHNIWYNIVNQM